MRGSALRRFGYRACAAIAVAASVLAHATPAYADGGASSSSALGGTDSATSDGGDGGLAGGPGSGSGGGGAGVNGGNGGDDSGTPGGAGGAGPGGSGTNGQASGTKGLGGGGGAHGYSGTTLPSGSTTGGAGGAGGSSVGAGGGGAGGYGAVATGAITGGTVGGALTGGAGGAGGEGTGGTGGGGGSGGIGLYLDVGNNQLTVSSTGSVTGGAGGAGGSGGSGGTEGAGGNGGTGLYINGGFSQITVSGTIVGGRGGDSATAAGVGGGALAFLQGGNSVIISGTLRGGDAGSSSVFVAGSAAFTARGNFIVTSTGVVSGGLGSDGTTRDYAIAITGSPASNSLTIYSGATIIGNVGTPVLKLGGPTAGTFDVSTLGAQYTVNSSLAKVDASTWTLTGTNSTFALPTNVQAGALAVNGVLDQSAVTVDSGATLKGTGTTGAVSVNAGGIHAPGNSIGTQTVNGNYTLGSGAILQIETAPGANNSDKVVVLSGGTVDITNAILQVIAANGAYAPSTEYLIIDNQGGQPVIGTFATITSNLAFLVPTVVYDGGDGDDVVLTLTSNGSPLQFCAVATTTNQCNVGNAVQALGVGNPLYDAVIGQSVDGARQAFNAMSGEVHSTLSSTLANDSHYVRDILLGRLAQAYYARTNAGTQVAGLMSNGPTVTAGIDGAPMMGLGMGEAAAGESAHDLSVSPLTFWTQGYGAWADFEGNGNSAGANRTLGGFLSGVDAMLDPGWRIGGALGYARSDVSVGGGRFSSADIDSYQLAAYTGGSVGGLVVRGGLVWSWSQIDTSRAVIFPGFAENVGASYSANTGQLFGEMAMPLAHADIAYEPFANLAWVGIDTGSFTEAGGSAALASNGSYDSIGYMTLGTRAAGSMLVHGVEAIPHGSIAWLHAFGDVNPGQGLAFAAYGQSFLTYGVPLAENSALINAGLDVRVSGGAALLGLSYTGQFAGNVNDNAVTGRIDWRF